MALQKRSLTLAGHRTSIALEAEFWEVLEAMAAAMVIPLPLLVARIDQGRISDNLSSELRVTALRWVQARSSQGATVEQ